MVAAADVELEVTVTGTCPERDRPPLPPWIVTVYMAAATLLSTLTVKVEEPEPPVIMAVPRTAEGPEGETAAVRLTLPVKPFAGVTVMVVEPEPPS